MTSSPSKQNALPTHQLASPRSAGRLRQMKSAHNLSTNYSAAGGPSLISQQRQQQLKRNASREVLAAPPSIPPVPSPQRNGRSRSNSDALLPKSTIPGIPPRKMPSSKKTLNPKEELESLIRHGTNGNAPAALQNLRHWILCEGMDADTDGMVNRPDNIAFRLGMLICQI